MSRFTEYQPGLGVPEDTLLHMGIIGPAPRELRGHRIFGGDLVAVAAQHPDWNHGDPKAVSVTIAFASTLGELNGGYVDRATAQEWVTEQVHAAAALLIEQQLN